MRIRRSVSGAVLLGAVAVLVPLAAGAAVAADDPGTTFRTAAPLAPGQQASASVSVGDYLYWSFTAKAGQTATVTATVQLPPGTERHGPEDWRLDLYDGLRRHQSCTGGTPLRAAGTDAGEVTVSCTLPRIRAWAETWSNDPLPGTYYARLTVGQVAEQDLGLPATAQVGLTEQDGPVQPAGATDVAPLTMPSTGPSDAGTAVAAPASAGVLSGRHVRWWWTGAGAVVAVLCGLGGFRLTRHPRGARRRPVPQAVPPAEWDV